MTKLRSFIIRLKHLPKKKNWTFNEIAFIRNVKYDLWVKGCRLCVDQRAISPSYNSLLALFLGAYGNVSNP